MEQQKLLKRRKLGKHFLSYSLHRISQYCGSGIRGFFDPLDRVWKKSRCGIRAEHPGFYFCELSISFQVKSLLKFLDADPDPGSGILSTTDLGSGMEKIGSGIRDLTSGSAALKVVRLFGIAVRYNTVPDLTLRSKAGSKMF